MRHCRELERAFSMRIKRIASAVAAKKWVRFRQVQHHCDLAHRFFKIGKTVVDRPADSEYGKITQAAGIDEREHL